MPSWLPPGRTAGFLEWLGEEGGGGERKRREDEEDRMRGEEEERVRGDKGEEEGNRKRKVKVCEAIVHGATVNLSAY